ncbi:MAG: DUF3347 domain-containing protein [Acidobacteria bacterium]|nr:DUF3347 domain-containing protein [Acidobacteriota bacterium]
MRRTKTTLLSLASVLLVTALTASAASAADGLDALMPHYETIRVQLVQDSTDGIAESGKTLREALETLRADLSAETAGVPAEKLAEVEGLLPEAIEAAKKLEKAEGIEAIRGAFYELTKPLVRWRQAAGGGPVVAYCPMKKQSWLQPEGDSIGNPYFGQMMAGCGEIVDG